MKTTIFILLLSFLSFIGFGQILDSKYVKNDTNKIVITTDTTIITGHVGIGTETPTRLLEVMELTPDSFAAIKVVQGSNTGSNSHAFIDNVSVSGDAFHVFGTDQGIDWSVGIDNSDANKFKISREFGMGVNDMLAIDTVGNVDIINTTGALIVSRLTTTQRDALTPINGMILYNTTTNAFNFYENDAWVVK